MQPMKWLEMHLGKFFLVMGGAVCFFFIVQYYNIVIYNNAFYLFLGEDNLYNYLT
jgi:hypothetical protein